MKLFYLFILLLCTVCLQSEEYIIKDELERDHLGRINVIRRFIRMNSDEILHREKAKMILYKEMTNIFQFWGGHTYIFIQGVGKIDYINNEGKHARKYSENAIIYSLSKEFSHLYFYENEVGIPIEATDLFPRLERAETSNHIIVNDVDRKLQEIIKNSSLESQKKLRVMEEQAEERRQQQNEAKKKAEEEQKRLEKQYKYSGSLLNVLKGVFSD